jgi:hypothetical protein
LIRNNYSNDESNRLINIDGNFLTYKSKIFIKNYTSDQVGGSNEVPLSEIYVVVDKYNPNLTLEFERKDLRNKTENFQINTEYEQEFLLSNMIPQRIKEITVSYSNNFCLHFVGFFTPLQKSKFDYYPQSGVYHIRNYGFRFENIQELIEVIKHKNLAGFSDYYNQYVAETDEDIYFLLFCPFANLGINSPFKATINYNFERSLNGKEDSNLLAKVILENDPETALNTLFDAMESDTSIVYSEHNLNLYTKDTEFNLELFEVSNDIITIFELFTDTGETIVEFDQNMKFGIVLENLMNTNLQFLAKKSENEKKIFYRVGSESIGYKISFILFRPSNLINERVIVKVKYSKKYSSSSNQIEFRDMTLPETDDSISVNEIIMYSLIGIGAIILILCLCLLIRYLKNKKKTDKKTEEPVHQRKSTNSQSIGFVRVKSNYTNNTDFKNIEEFMTTENR